MTTTDKGSPVVTFDVNNQTNEAAQQMDNTENCKKMSHNPTIANNKTVNKVISKFP